MIRLTTTIKSCYMLEDPVKIIHNRITSLDLHSSEQKFLALAGDKSGNIGEHLFCYEVSNSFKNI